MFFIVYAFKGQVHVFAGRVKIVSHSYCRTSALLKIKLFLLEIISYDIYWKSSVEFVSMSTHNNFIT